MLARNPKSRFIVTLEASADGADVQFHALRILLKRLLRSRPSFRCVDVQEVHRSSEEGANEH